jgi:hypothetical protein
MEETGSADHGGTVTTVGFLHPLSAFGVQFPPVTVVVEPNDERKYLEAATM